MTQFIHKHIDIGEFSSKLNKLDGNILVHGLANCGKSTLVKHSFVNVLETTNIDNIANSINTYTILVRSIDTKKNNEQKAYVSYMQKYPHVKFVFTSRSYNVANELLSRVNIFRYYIPRSVMTQKMQELCGIGDQLDVEQIYTYHDLLLTLEARIYGLTFEECQPYLKFARTICQNLTKFSHAQIRKHLYDMMLCCMDKAYVFRVLLKELLEKHPKAADLICNTCAEFEHKSALGNKDIYHYEAFLFHIKNKSSLQDG